jgi:hypothetical protein
MFRKEYLRKCMKLKRKTLIKKYHNSTRNSAVHRRRGILLVVKRQKVYVVRFRVLTAALIKAEPFWSTTPCWLTNSYRHVGRESCLSDQNRPRIVLPWTTLKMVETALQYVGKHFEIDRASYPRTLDSSVYAELEILYRMKDRTYEYRVYLTDP